MSILYGVAIVYHIDMTHNSNSFRNKKVICKSRNKYHNMIVRNFDQLINTVHDQRWFYINTIWLTVYSDVCVLFNCMGPYGWIWW